MANLNNQSQTAKHTQAKPEIKDFCKPFSLDSKLVCFDSKSYAKEAKIYIDHIEKINNELLEALQEVRAWYEENHSRLLGELTPICFSTALSAITKATGGNNL